MATIRQQLTPVSDQTPAPVSVPARELSGRAWVGRFPSSADVEDLVEPFRGNVKRFLAALAAAGIAVDIAATYRPRERAYLMHYSYKIAHKLVAPEDVEHIPSVPIEWVHPSEAESIRAAAEMVRAYGIEFPPALESNHSRRRAIDMRLHGVLGKTVARADGEFVKIKKHTANDSDLYAVGASYNVHKLVSDKPHWSDDGK